MHQMTMEVLDRYPELLSRILLSDTDHDDLLRHGTCQLTLNPRRAARATLADPRTCCACSQRVRSRGTGVVASGAGEPRVRLRAGGRPHAREFAKTNA